MKNVLFWCGVKGNEEVKNKFKYDDYSWMEYSKITWEYWCRKNNVIFLHYDKTSLEDQMKYKINWQRWIDIVPFVHEKVGDFDQILAIDASFMIKWDAPNFFNNSDNKWCGLIGNENLKWVTESIEGYKPLFNNFEFDYSQHLLAGFTLFNKSHIQFFEKLTKFYFDNHEQIVMLEDKMVKRGRDQPVLNYLLQINKIDVKKFPLSYGANHMWRRNMLNGNPYSNDSTPLFIKYLYTWCFSGFPDRGNSRTELMKQTWEIVKDNYV
jgi:hypothetical protein